MSPGTAFLHSCLQKSDSAVSIARHHDTACLFRKLTAVITAASFIFSFVAAPAVHAVIPADHSVVKALPPVIAPAWGIPSDAGRITAARMFGNAPPVIIIQDLHCHPEVQKNIVRILSRLDADQGIENIYLEGAYGDVSTGWLAAMTRTDIGKKVLEAELDRGWLDGAEYYSIISGKTGIIKGLENKLVYDENIRRLKQMMELRAEARPALDAMESECAVLQKRYFSRGNAALIRLKQWRDNSSLSSKSYYRRIIRLAEKAHMDMSRYPDMARFYAVVKSAEKLSLPRASRELQKVMAAFRKVIPFQEYQNIASLAGDNDRRESLLSLITETAFRHHIDLAAEYPHLAGLIAYQSQQALINPQSLVREECSLLYDLHRRFAASPAERDIVFLTEFTRLTEDVLFNHVSADDHAWYEAHVKEFNDMWPRYSRLPGPASVDRMVKLSRDFYAANVERNRYFFNAITAGPGTGYPVSTKNKGFVNVVVAGGFHTDGLARLLREKRISHVVVTPAITGGTASSNRLYEELIRSQNTVSAQTIAALAVAQTPFDKAVYRKVANAVRILLAEERSRKDAVLESTAWLSSLKDEYVNEHPSAVVPSFEIDVQRVEMKKEGYAFDLGITFGEERKVYEVNGAGEVSEKKVMDVQKGNTLASVADAAVNRTMGRVFSDTFGEGWNEKPAYRGAGKVIYAVYTVIGVSWEILLMMPGGAIVGKWLSGRKAANEVPHAYGVTAAFSASLVLSAALWGSPFAFVPLAAAAACSLWQFYYSHPEREGKEHILLAFAAMVTAALWAPLLIMSLGLPIPFFGALPSVVDAAKDGVIFSTAVHALINAPSLILRGKGIRIPLLSTIEGRIYRILQQPSSSTLKDVWKINSALKKLIKNSGNDPESLMGFIHMHCGCVDRAWEDPVQSKWPLLKAIRLLSREEEDALLAFIDRAYPEGRHPLAEAIMLMNDRIGEKWLERNAPRLAGKTVYLLSDENSYWVGGLGPVIKNFERGLAELGAITVCLEPKYLFRRDRRGPDGESLTLDYGENGDQQINDIRVSRTFDVPMEGRERPVKIEVSEGEARFKAGDKETGKTKHFLVRDVREDGSSYYSKDIYNYGKDGNASFGEHCAFMARAFVESMEYEEGIRKKTLGDAYEPPVIMLNDAQMSLVPAIIASHPEKYPLASKAFFVFTTHTYMNRVEIGLSDGMHVLKDIAGIRDDIARRFIRLNENGEEIVDYSKGALEIVGYLLNGLVFAVSKDHRDNLTALGFDPLVNLIAMTNGLDRETMGKNYREIFTTYFPDGDPDRPTAEQIRFIHWYAINAFNHEKIRRSREPEDGGIVPEFAHIDAANDDEYEPEWIDAAMAAKELANDAGGISTLILNSRNRQRGNAGTTYPRRLSEALNTVIGNNDLSQYVDEKDIDALHPNIKVLIEHNNRNEGKVSATDRKLVNKAILALKYPKTLAKAPQKYDVLIGGYARRGVSEKTGETTAWTRKNIEKWVKEGAPVVLMINDQGETSVEIIRNFRRIQEDIEKKKKENPDEYPGQFIFIERFPPSQKVLLLSLITAQVQPSPGNPENWREREANGSTEEAPIGLIEICERSGAMADQGIPIEVKRDTNGKITKVHPGSVIIVKEHTEKAYEDAYDLLFEIYTDHPQAFYECCAIAAKLAPVCDYHLTVAAALQVINKALEAKEQAGEKKKSAIMNILGMQHDINIPVRVQRTGLAALAVQLERIMDTDDSDTPFDYFGAIDYFRHRLEELYGGTEAKNIVIEWMEWLKNEGNRDSSSHQKLVWLADFLEELSAQLQYIESYGESSAGEDKEAGVVAAARYFPIRNKKYFTPHSVSADTARGSVAERFKEHISVKAEGDTIPVVVDQRLHISERDLKDAMESAARALGKEAKKIPANVEILRLNKSACLFEDHMADGFIGVNRAIGRIDNGRLRQAILRTGIFHELCHEMAGRSNDAFEAEQLKRDAEYFLRVAFELNVPREQIFTGDYDNDIALWTFWLAVRDRAEAMWEDMFYFEHEFGNALQMLYYAVEFIKMNKRKTSPALKSVLEQLDKMSARRRSESAQHAIDNYFEDIISNATRRLSDGRTAAGEGNNTADAEKEELYNKVFDPARSHLRSLWNLKRQSPPFMRGTPREKVEMVAQEIISGIESEIDRRMQETIKGMRSQSVPESEIHNRKERVSRQMDQVLDYASRGFMTNIMFTKTVLCCIFHEFIHLDPVFREHLESADVGAILEWLAFIAQPETRCGTRFKPCGEKAVIKCGDTTDMCALIRLIASVIFYTRHQVHKKIGSGGEIVVEVRKDDGSVVISIGGDFPLDVDLDSVFEEVVSMHDPRDKRLSLHAALEIIEQRLGGRIFTDKKPFHWFEIVLPQEEEDSNVPTEAAAVHFRINPDSDRWAQESEIEGRPVRMRENTAGGRTINVWNGCASTNINFSRVDINNKARNISIIIDDVMLGPDTKAREQQIKDLVDEAAEKAGGSLKNLMDKNTFIVLVDKSPNLFNDHVGNGLITVNRSILRIEDKVFQKALLMTGIFHEMCHETSGESGESFEAEQLERDIDFFFRMAHDLGVPPLEIIEEFQKASNNTVDCSTFIEACRERIEWQDKMWHLMSFLRHDFGNIALLLWEHEDLPIMPLIKGLKNAADTYSFTGGQAFDAYEKSQALEIVRKHAGAFMDLMDDKKFSEDLQNRLELMDQRHARAVSNSLVYARHILAYVYPEYAPAADGFDLNTMIESVKHLTRQNILSELEPEVRIPKGTCIKTDVPQSQSGLYCTLANIVINCREAMNDRDILLKKEGLVYHPKMDISFGTEGAYGVISITDNGGGIDDGLLPDIFKYGVSTKENKKGPRGVGLAFARDAVTAMNGSIAAKNIFENGEKAGARFEIKIPLAALRSNPGGIVSSAVQAIETAVGLTPPLASSLGTASVIETPEYEDKTVAILPGSFAGYGDTVKEFRGKGATVVCFLPESARSEGEVIDSREGSRAGVEGRYFDIMAQQLDAHYWAVYYPDEYGTDKDAMYSLMNAFLGDPNNYGEILGNRPAVDVIIADPGMTADADQLKQIEAASKATVVFLDEKGFAGVSENFDAERKIDKAITGLMRPHPVAQRIRINGIEIDTIAAEIANEEDIDTFVIADLFDGNHQSIDTEYLVDRIQKECEKRGRGKVYLYLDCPIYYVDAIPGYLDQGFDGARIYSLRLELNDQDVARILSVNKKIRNDEKYKNKEVACLVPAMMHPALEAQFDDNGIIKVRTIVVNEHLSEILPQPAEKDSNTWLELWHNGNGGISLDAETFESAMSKLMKSSYRTIGFDKELAPPGMGIRKICDIVRETVIEEFRLIQAQKSVREREEEGRELVERLERADIQLSDDIVTVIINNLSDKSIINDNLNVFKNSPLIWAALRRLSSGGENDVAAIRGFLHQLLGRHVDMLMSPEGEIREREHRKILNQVLAQWVAAAGKINIPELQAVLSEKEGEYPPISDDKKPELIADSRAFLRAASHDDSHVVDKNEYEALSGRLEAFFGKPPTTTLVLANLILLLMKDPRKIDATIPEENNPLLVPAINALLRAA